MTAKLDGKIDLGRQCIKVGSWQRGCDERAAVGVDGVVSIDFGRRSREIVGEGVIKALSSKGLSEKIRLIEATIDGLCHELVVGDESFGDVRVDSFEVVNKYSSGANVCCEYKVKYTQLRKS